MSFLDHTLRMLDHHFLSYYQNSEPLSVSFYPPGGPWQAFPDPKAVPGPEALSCQIPSAQIPAPQQQRQRQLQLPHQLLQQFQWKCVSGTPTSWLCHACVRQETETTDAKNGQMACGRKQFELLSGISLFYFEKKNYNLGAFMGLLSFMCVLMFFSIIRIIIRLLRGHNVQVFLNQNSHLWCSHTVIFSFWEGLELFLL